MTLRTEFLDHVAPFELVAVAQDAVNGWVHAYNHQRPHQALDMAVPRACFDATAPTRLDAANGASQQPVATALSLVIDVIEAPRQPPTAGTAIEFEVRVPRTHSCRANVAFARQ